MGSVVGFVDSEPFADKELLLEVDVAVPIPAAVESVINERNAGCVRAMFIVEGANGPTTAMAGDFFESGGRSGGP